MLRILIYAGAVGTGAVKIARGNSHSNSKADNSAQEIPNAVSEIERNKDLGVLMNNICAEDRQTYDANLQEIRNLKLEIEKLENANEAILNKARNEIDTQKGAQESPSKVDEILSEVSNEENILLEQSSSKPDNEVLTTEPSASDANVEDDVILMPSMAVVIEDANATSDQQGLVTKEVAKKEFDIFRTIFQRNLHATTVNACLDFLSERDAQAFLCVSKSMNKNCGGKTFARWFLQNWDGVTTVLPRHKKIIGISSKSCKQAFDELKQAIVDNAPIEKIEFEDGNSGRWGQSGFTDMTILDVHNFLEELKKNVKDPAFIDEFIILNLPPAPVVPDYDTDDSEEIQMPDMGVVIDHVNATAQLTNSMQPDLLRTTDACILFLCLMQCYGRLRFLKMDFNDIRIENVKIPSAVEVVDITNVRLIEKITIPKSVKSARLDRSDLIELELTNGLQKLDLAFLYNLRVLTVPQTVSHLELRRLANLENLELQDGLQNVTIDSLYMLKSVKFPESVSHLKLASCGNLADSLQLHEGLLEVKLYDLHNKVKMKKLKVPNTVTNLDLHNFDDLEDLQVAATLINLKLNGLKSLKNLNLSEGLQKLDLRFMDKSTLKQVPKTVKSLTLHSLNSLYRLEVLAQNVEIDSMRTLKFLIVTKTVSNLKLINLENLERLEVKDGLESVDLKTLHNLKVFKSVKTMIYLKLNDLRNLDNLELGDGVQNVDLEKLSNLNALKIPRTVTSLRLDNCLNLEHLELEEAEVLPNVHLAWLSKLKSLKVPKTAKSISLYKLENFEDLQLQEGTQTVHLEYLKKLIFLKVPTTVTDLKLTELFNLEQLELEEGLQNVHLRRLDNLKLLQFPTGLKDLELRELKTLKSLELPSTMTSVKLRSIENLEDLDLHDGLEEVVLYSLKRLKVVKVPRTVVTLKLNYLENIEELALEKGLRNVELQGLTNLKILTYAGENVEGLNLQGRIQFKDGVFQNC